MGQCSLSLSILTWLESVIFVLYSHSLQTLVLDQEYIWLDKILLDLQCFSVLKACNEVCRKLTCPQLLAWELRILLNFGKWACLGNEVVLSHPDSWYFCIWVRENAAARTAVSPGVYIIWVRPKGNSHIFRQHCVILPDTCLTSSLCRTGFSCVSSVSFVIKQ